MTIIATALPITSYTCPRSNTQNEASTISQKLEVGNAFKENEKARSADGQSWERYFGSCLNDVSGYF